MAVTLNSDQWAEFYRDAKVLDIGEGTSEIHRLILARDLGMPQIF
jgi:alkylation response protein AidB-like acyl-CoA dehydrogenase